MPDESNLAVLVTEYEDLLVECRNEAGQYDWHAFVDGLSTECEWTREGAQAVASLVHDYGSFVLRNAAAIAIAARIGDGRLGL